MEAFALANLPPTLAARDEALDIRIQELRGDRGQAAAHAYILKLYRDHPRPHVQALYASDLGETAQAEAVAVALQAAKAGSWRALNVLGWALAQGKVVARDLPRAGDLVRRAANAGDPAAMFTMGEFFQSTQPVKAEYWYDLASYHGLSRGLYLLGQQYDAGQSGGKPDHLRACQLYLKASIRHSDEAYTHLKELADHGDAAGSFYRDRFLIIFGAAGANLQSQVYTAAVNHVAAQAGDDPQVLTELGLFYWTAFRAGYFDAPKAKEYFQKAAQLGGLDAQADLAWMKAEGIGEPKDPAGALAAWKQLAAKNNAEALSILGYYRYWGSLDRVGWEKNTTLTYYYSKRAAEAGSAYGAWYAGWCLGDGIGTPRDYAQAAVLVNEAISSGFVIGYPRMRRRLDSYLAFVEP